MDRVTYKLGFPITYLGAGGADFYFITEVALLSLDLEVLPEETLEVGNVDNLVINGLLHIDVVVDWAFFNRVASELGNGFSWHREIYKI